MSDANSSCLPSPGESFWARCDVPGGWQERKMERYCSVGFDDDHGFGHKISDIGLTWRLTAPTCTVTPWAVICRNHGQQFLTEEQYERQLDRPDSLWTCPVCGDSATWDDDNFERKEFGGEGDAGAEEYAASVALKCKSKHAPCGGCMQGGMCDNFDGIEERDSVDAEGEIDDQ